MSFFQAFEFLFIAGITWNGQFKVKHTLLIISMKNTIDYFAINKYKGKIIREHIREYLITN